MRLLIAGILTSVLLSAGEVCASAEEQVDHSCGGTGQQSCDCEKTDKYWTSQPKEGDHEKGELPGNRWGNPHLNGEVAPWIWMILADKKNGRPGLDKKSWELYLDDEKRCRFLNQFRQQAYDHARKFELLLKGAQEPGKLDPKEKARLLEALRNESGWIKVNGKIKQEGEVPGADKKLLALKKALDAIAAPAGKSASERPSEAGKEHGPLGVFETALQDVLADLERKPGPFSSQADRARVQDELSRRMEEIRAGTPTMPFQLIKDHLKAHLDELRKFGEDIQKKPPLPPQMPERKSPRRQAQRDDYIPIQQGGGPK